MQLPLTDSDIDVLKDVKNIATAKQISFDSAAQAYMGNGINEEREVQSNYDNVQTQDANQFLATLATRADQEARLGAVMYHSLRLERLKHHIENVDLDPEFGNQVSEMYQQFGTEFVKDFFVKNNGKVQVRSLSGMLETSQKLLSASSD